MSGDFSPYAPPEAETEKVTDRVVGSAEYPREPYKTIWFSPRKTIAGIIEHKPDFHMNRLIILGGISSAFSEQAEVEPGMSLLMLVPFLVLGGIFGSFVYKFVAGWGFRVVGSWLGGTASSNGLHNVIAWSYVPVVMGLPLAVFGWFTLTQPELFASGQFYWVTGLFAIVVGVLALWSVVITVAGLAAAHGFSLWKGFFTFLIALILAITLAVAVVMGIAFVFE